MNDIQNKPPKYMVYVDAREESRVALRLACMKARVRGGKVDILHVIAPGDFQTLGGVAERMREERYQEAEALIKELANSAYNMYGVTPGIVLREGKEGDEIISATLADHDIIMLVIGITPGSGHNTIASWLASQLGGKLLVPLLMVPGNLTDQQLQCVI